MKTYADLHGNMQMYGIKSLYGNKVNLALVENNVWSKALANVQNIPLLELAQKACERHQTTMQEVTEKAFKHHEQLGKTLPRRLVTDG